MAHDQLSKWVKGGLFLFLVLMLAVLLLYGSRIENRTRKPPTVATTTDALATLQDATVQSIIAVANKQLKNWAPEKPSNGAEWVPVRYEFVSDSVFYIHYEDSLNRKVVKRILVEWSGSIENEKSYRVTAYFTADLFEWKTIWGVDTYYEYPKALYEYAYRIGTWVQR